MPNKSSIVRIEHRTCPFCGHEYMRNVYREASTDSICPKCRKRSDKTSNRSGRWKRPVLTKCKLPECDNMFYKLGNVNYCSQECRKIADRKSNARRLRKWRKKNPEKVKQYSKEYLKKNREKHNEYQRRWRAKNSNYFKERYKKQKEENIKNSK